MKRCLVLGGSGNIGAAICRTLHRENAQVAFTYRKNVDFAHDLAQEISATAYSPCDFNRPAEIPGVIDELVRNLGGLDALICATGGDGQRYQLKLGEIETSDIDYYFAMIARGVFLACQSAARVMSEQKSGNIVVLGSLDGYKAVPSAIHFATAKAALRGMVESMSKELGKFNVKVNLLAPGLVEGGASAYLAEGLKAEYLKYCSLKRLARAQEIAEVAIWFALENTFVTGQPIVLNGGL